ncbi:hypothetical protein [Caulobacter segnis]|uniref:hypothetical protein n=1 Tax=Caulobacter segnis TaxID=88688 RepID=UPI001CBDAD12|nr:hypothetical protein [Caulobacter segnis]UAL09925.1 hypothetical protein K8940_19465 [Caulobacter segnis]
MKRDEIDDMLDAMAKEAAEKGDDSLLPGVISFNSSKWVKMSGADLPTTCMSVKVGIRYRAIRVMVASTCENGVASRAEDANDHGEPYMELEPRA